MFRNICLLHFSPTQRTQNGTPSKRGDWRPLVGSGCWGYSVCAAYFETVDLLPFSHFVDGMIRPITNLDTFPLCYMDWQTNWPLHKNSLIASLLKKQTATDNPFKIHKHTHTQSHTNRRRFLFINYIKFWFSGQNPRLSISFSCWFNKSFDVYTL